jgi:hypothetical protein
VVAAGADSLPSAATAATSKRYPVARLRLPTVKVPVPAGTMSTNEKSGSAPAFRRTT